MRSVAIGLALLGAVVAVALSGGESAGSATGKTANGDVLALETTVTSGPLKRILGTSYEWYSPASGAYRIDHTDKSGHSLVVYDGVTVTRRVDGGIVRVSGTRRFVKALQGWPLTIFAAPGINITNFYRSGRSSPGLRITAKDGGKILDANFHYTDENNLSLHIPFHVVTTRTMTPSQAHAAGVFRPLRGRLVGEFRQSKPGTRPHYGEPAYWFGPTLGRARAVTMLENWGLQLDSEPSSITGRYQSNPGADRRNAHYETIYRLPPAAAPPAHSNPPNLYPGVGNTNPADIDVDCKPAHRPFPAGSLLSKKGTPITLDDGEHASLKISRYTQFYRDGVFAAVVTRKTVCGVNGLISAAQLRKLARALRPA
jgi:hypothetical protein